MANAGSITIPCILDPEKFEKEYAKLQQDLEKNQEKLNQKATIKASLEINKSSIERTIKDLQRKSDEIEEKLSSKKVKLSTMGAWEGSSQYTKLEKEISSLENELGDIGARIGNQESKWNVVDMKIQQVDRQTQKLNEDQQRYNASLNEMDAQRQKTSSGPSQWWNSFKESIKGGFQGLSEQMEGMKAKSDELLHKARNWLLAVFSIRGAYSLIKHAISTVSQYNTELADKIASIKYTLAMAIAPVIETIVNWVYTIIQYIQYIVKALTGYDIFANAAKSSAKSMASAASSAKTIHKELAGFDEMNVLSDNSSSGGGSAGGGVPEAMAELSDVEIPQWLKDLVEFLKPIWEWISKIAEALGPVGTFLALWGGGKLVKLIGSLIGSKGAGGILGLIGALEAFVAYMGIVKPIVEDYDAIANRTGSGNWFENAFIAIGKNFDNWLSDIFNFKVGGIKEKVSSFGTAYNFSAQTGLDWVDSFQITSMYDTLRDLQDALFNVNKEYENNVKAVNQSGNEAAMYLSKLNKLIDSNGQVKEGYEGTAGVLIKQLAQATGQNITLDGQQIKINGKEVKSFNELRTSIDKTVKAMKQKLEAEKLEKEMSTLYEAEIELRQKLERAEQRLAEAQLEGDQKKIESAQLARDNIARSLEDTLRKEESVSQEMVENQIRTTNELSKGLVEQYDLSCDTLDEIFKNNKKNWEETYNQLDSDRKWYMLSATTELKNHKDEYVRLWTNLANESEQSFAKGLVNMNADEQRELTSMLQGTGTKAEQIANKLGKMPTHAREYLQQNWGTLYEKYNGNLDTMVTKATIKGNEIANNISNPMKNLQYNSGTWGKDYIENWVNGVQKGWKTKGGLVFQVAQKVEEIWKHSIPDPSSPFAGDQYWGEHFIDNITNGIKRGAPNLIKTAQSVADQVAEITEGGLINYPSSGTLIYGANDFNNASSIGKEIGKNISLNATIVNKMNSRVISRELLQVQAEQDFAYNS